MVAKGKAFVMGAQDVELGQTEKLANSREATRMQMQFGKRLRAARIASGYETARDMAYDLSVGEARYNKYERGEAIPPLDILAQICKLTDRSSDFFLFGNGMATPRRTIHDGTDSDADIG